MKRESTPHARSAATSARSAGWIALLATLAFVAVLAAAHSAQALTLSAPGPLAGTSAEIPFEGPGEGAPEAGDEAEEGEETELESCEVFEVEGEEEEICEETDPGEVPEDCLLASSSATVSANTASDRVRLAIRYTTSAPAAVDVEYFLRGRKGPLSFDEQRKRFGKAGVFRATVELTEAQMEKVLAAKSFRVRLRAENAPRSCDRFFDRSLTARHAAGRELTWSDPEASARPGR